MTSKSALAGALFAMAIASSVATAQPLNKTIESIERRYNSLSGLQMQFEQSMEYSGQRRMVETGTLYLQRPGKMRWDYTKPAGKVAVSDGTIFRMYNPHSNQVRQVELEAMTDLRAPLSFLLGRMRLRRMFRNLRIEEAGGQPVLIGDGRNARDFYSRVEFDVDPAAYSITGIRIVGRDESVNVYQFSDEQVNPALSESMFEFKAPEGAEVVPLTRNCNDVPLNLGQWRRRHRPPALLLHPGRLEEHWQDGHVLHATAPTGLDPRDAFHDIHALDHAAEYRVAESQCAPVQRGVGLQVDEELRTRGVLAHLARHGHRTALVAHAVLRLNAHGLAGGLRDEFRGEAAALDDKAFDHAVEDCVVIKAGVDVCEEVGNGLGR